MSAHAGPRPDATDPRRAEYDARKSLLSLSITFVIAALVFGGFYFFSPRGPDVPTGPPVTQSINHDALPTPDALRASAPVQVPNTP